MGQTLEIFMPVYEGSLLSLVAELRQGNEPDVTLREWTETMLRQILLALDHVHTRGTIHRDVKPANILYKGGKFFLTDFGIAKNMDSLRTIIGTPPYAAPELFSHGEQTPKLDIYSLGVTVVECVKELPPRELLPQRQPWHQALQVKLLELAPTLASMLADIPDQRPTARQLLEDALQQSPAGLFQRENLRNDINPSNASPPERQADTPSTIYTAALTAMDWTRTIATAIYRGVAQSTQRNDNLQPLQPPQPNPEPHYLQPPNSSNTPPTQTVRTTRPARSVRSVKSAKSAKVAGSANRANSTNNNRNRSGEAESSSRYRRYTRSQSVATSNQELRRSRRSISKSILKAPELRELGFR